MALRENERVALICNMFIETVPSTPELELPSMQKVIELLQQLCRAGVAEEFDDKGETLLYIADVKSWRKLTQPPSCSPMPIEEGQIRR